MFNRQFGLTLVETMITTVIVSIGLTLAVPTWNEMVSKRQVTGSAEEVAAFLSHAQSYALKSNQEVTVTFTRSGDGASWCLGAIDANAKLANSLDHCDCNTTAQCTLDGQESVLDEGAFDSVAVPHSRVQFVSSDDFNFNFDPIRGLITTDMGIVDTNRYAIVVESANTGSRLRVFTLTTGRTKICNPFNDGALPAYKYCG